MQFRGHSLPVRQSMSVPWEFFTSSHFISQFPPTRFPLITAIRMCHFFPVHHHGMAFLAGSKAKIQHIYIYIYIIFSFLFGPMREKVNLKWMVPQRFFKVIYFTPTRDSSVFSQSSGSENDCHFDLFSLPEDSDKILKTRTGVKLIPLRDKSLCRHFHFKIFTFFSHWTINIYIYIYSEWKKDN